MTPVDVQKVFIGHGRSGAWRELKDFVQDRLRLPWDEFNRVPAAGVGNVDRLAEMLDSATIALLVLSIGLLPEPLRRLMPNFALWWNPTAAAVFAGLVIYRAFTSTRPHRQ